MPALLALKLFAGNALRFLGSLNVWQLLCIVLLAFAGLQTLRLHSEQRHARKLEAQVSKLSGELQRISTTRNNQRVVTEKNVTHAREIVKQADERARKVESAPLKPNCQTPDAVLSADL
jgi:hypothetical protein